jgi:hypothetical protein
MKPGAGSSGAGTLQRAVFAPTVMCMLAALAVGLATCKVDEEAFHHRLYGCNPNAANPACGTDQDDRPMACVPAYQLGGRNFCASGCDVMTDPTESEAAVCQPSGPRTAGPVSGARLPRCTPITGVEGDDPCRHEELSCMRTDLLSDEGVCMTVNSCTNSADCRDPVRSTCMGELLRETYAGGDLKSDHTYCLQAGCQASGTACSPGEACLRNLLPRTSFPPDICVPTCDANKNCPPNYFCYSELYSAQSPQVCLPGLLGLRCKSKLDCLFGDCVETGAHFKVCSVPCASDADCIKYDSIQGTLFCAKESPAPSGAGFCAGARAFRGSICYEDRDCLYPGEICARINPVNDYGQCLQACNQGECPSYGGVPHACRPQIDKAGSLALSGLPYVCWPGYFGQLCRDTGQCIPGLDCKSASATVALLKVCSISCTSTADCAANRFTEDGWCDTALSICRAPILDKQPCAADFQCESKRCLAADMDGVRRCDVTVGY